jgi:hypothetical protein
VAGKGGAAAGLTTGRATMGEGLARGSGVASGKERHIGLDGGSPGANASFDRPRIRAITTHSPTSSPRRRPGPIHKSGESRIPAFAG